MKRTLIEMNAASLTVTIAVASLHTATNAQVRLSAQEYQTLSAGECGWITTDAAYLSARATYEAAVLALSEAKSEYTLSIQMHSDAVTTAARLKLECECAARTEHAEAWADANKDNDSSAAAWSQAHHIECVIAKTSEANCVFVSGPVVTRPNLCDSIPQLESGESCQLESSQALDEPDHQPSKLQGE